MNKNEANNDERKQRQLVTVMTVVMVPVIILLAMTKVYYLLGVAIVIELALIVWSVALANKSGNAGSTSRKDSGL